MGQIFAEWLGYLLEKHESSSSLLSSAAAVDYSLRLLAYNFKTTLESTINVHRDDILALFVREKIN